MNKVHAMDIIKELLESEDEDLESSEDDLELFDIFSSDSDTSSSDSESDLEGHSVKNEFADTIRNYSDGEFKKNFRLNRSTVYELTDKYKISDVMRNQRKGGRATMGAEKEIYVFLWYIGSSNTFGEIGNLFGISKSHAWTVVVKVSTWLINTNALNYVKWPSEEEVPHLMTLWEREKKFPNVIGVIDCSHIRIKAPRLRKNDYMNRKRFYSLNLQAVVDVNKKFLDVFVGEPGSLDESCVLRKSQLFQQAHANKGGTFPHKTFLLGNSSYPSLDWIITPFSSNRHLSREAKQFNSLHSSARTVVEITFGMLKTRFRRLLHCTEQSNLNFLANIIFCACILHNICLNGNDDFQEIDEPIVADMNDEEPDASTQNGSRLASKRRQQVMNYLIRKGVIA